MFGRPEWFGRRKYGGWGLTPTTWMGWVYIAVMVAPLFIINSSGLDGGKVFWLTSAWMTIFLLDVFDIILKLKKDERETHIEAVSERNAAWAMVAVIIIGIFYQIYTSISSGNIMYDPFLFAALIIGALVKSISNFILERKM